MALYSRNEEGFAAAFAAVKQTARLHPQRKYALYVDRRTPDEYAVSMASLVSEENVEPGTRANTVDAEGNMTPMFPSDDPD
jgi:hypothetical protein